MRVFFLQDFIQMTIFRRCISLVFALCMVYMHIGVAPQRAEINGHAVFYIAAHVSNIEC